MHVCNKYFMYENNIVLKQVQILKRNKLGLEQGLCD